MFVVNFLPCIINGNQVFYQSIHAIFLRHEYILILFTKKSRQMFRLCQKSVLFSVLKLQCLFFFKHAVVLLVNTLQHVKMAHALTYMHVHVLRVIPELIVILLLVCRISFTYLNMPTTRLIYIFFQCSPYFIMLIFFFSFSIFPNFVLFQTCNNSDNSLFCLTF